jgi:hypothetical protein
MMTDYVIPPPLQAVAVAPTLVAKFQVSLSVRGMRLFSNVGRKAILR